MAITRVKVWIAGEVLTASDLNAEIDNIVNNLDPSGFGGCSDTLTEKRSVADPSSDLATTLEEEIKQIRYQINAIIGKSYWYESAPASLVSMLPTGIVLPYSGSTAPSGYLLCYGQAVSRTTYASLFALIGTTFGSGDGSTTFNLPDLRGRVPLGKDNMGGVSADRITDSEADTLGAASGSENHYHTGPSHTHTGPSHYHLMKFGRRDDGAGAFGVDTGDLSGETFTSVHVNGSFGVASSTCYKLKTESAGTGNTGSSGTGNTSTTDHTMPYQTLNYIIKT